MAPSIALLALIVAVCAVTVAESRALPDALPMPVVVEFGSPMLLVRDKRASYPSYPQSAMMFTGFYRPTRHSASSGGIYAQGNSVGGRGAYFGQPQYLKDGPEPADEPEISSADAEAAPAAPEDVADSENATENQQPERKPEHEESTTPTQDTEDTENKAENPANQEPVELAQKQPTQKHPSRGQTKKGKKIPIPAEEEDEDEYDDDDEEPILPFVPPRPGKGGRRNKNYPSLNNFFPMVFSFPRGTAGATGTPAGSPPGLIAAIANSYSTGKGGVANSVATAYGGAPTKKQRRISTTE